MNGFLLLECSPFCLFKSFTCFNSQLKPSPVKVPFFLVYCKGFVLHWPGGAANTASWFAFSECRMYTPHVDFVLHRGRWWISSILRPVPLQSTCLAPACELTDQGGHMGPCVHLQFWLISLHACSTGTVLPPRGQKLVLVVQKGERNLRYYVGCGSPKFNPG